MTVTSLPGSVRAGPEREGERERERGREREREMGVHPPYGI